MDKAILYYTCNTHDPRIERACRKQLDRARAAIPLVCVSREPVDYGDWNMVVEGPRGPLTMHKQIVAGLGQCLVDDYLVFLCESDVLYHRSHFDFEPEEDVFFYNTNVWRLRWPDGFAVWTDDLQQVSGCCASGEVLYQFYKRRIAEIEQDGFDRHYEAGRKTGVPRDLVRNRQSRFPNLDIRHRKTLTKSKWSPEDFRNKKYARGWRETRDRLPCWGYPADVLGRIQEGTFVGMG